MQYTSPMTDEEQKEVLRKLYPNLADEEPDQAGETLDRYLAFAWEISTEINIANEEELKNSE
jgi:hypothetical protein